MKKTLIIHPHDPSTHFLDIVYNSIPNKTVITGNVTRKELRRLIQSHDRVMIMGHGTPSGLLSVGRFIDGGSHIIDYSMVDVLKEKTDNVYIWCNADKFVEKYDLKGFYSGMFISEVGEAYFCGLYGTSQDIVDESNYGFCHILSEYIQKDKNEIHEIVKTEYGNIAVDNPVAYYNNKRLYVH